MFNYVKYLVTLVLTLVCCIRQGKHWNREQERSANEVDAVVITLEQLLGDKDYISVTFNQMKQLISIFNSSSI